MAKTFRTTVIHAGGTVFDGETESLIARGRDGFFGILANHAPLIASLDPGKLVVRGAGGQEEVLFCAGGILEVARNKVRILADACECPEDIDYERACKAESRAQERLRRRNDPSIDETRAEAALHRALRRKLISERYGH